MKKLNDRGFAKAVLIYLLIGGFVGGFVYAGSSSKSLNPKNAEWERERLSDRVRELESESESRQRQESGTELQEWGQEQANAEAGREWSEHQRVEGPRETRERRRENRERDRESPDANLREGRRDPNDQGGNNNTEDIPSESQPTVCESQKAGELCATLDFRYERPHKSFLWYLSQPEASEGFRILRVKAMNTDVSDGKNVAGLRSLIVYYADGDQEDLIQAAKDSGKFRNRISGSGVLHMKKGDEFFLYLRHKKAVEAVFLKSDSWIAKGKSAQLEYRWMNEESSN